MNTVKAVAASAALAFLGSAATAATVTVTDIYGSWISAGPTSAYGVNFDTDDERTQVWWGKVPNGWSQSGYEFDGSETPMDVVADTEFVLGTFTHFNNPIYTYPGNGYTTAITEAQLQVDFELMIGTETMTLSQVYTFNHEETKNGGENGVCAHAGAPGGSGVNSNGCADRVTATLNEALSDSLVVDGMRYSFNISGFETGGGSPLDYFLTKERATNTASLVGSYSVAAVPLPAAGWMLLAGIGGLAAMKRRRKAASA